MDNKAEISRIEDIDIEGVGRITLKKLVDAGYSIELLVTLPPQVIAREAKINVKKAILISEYVRKAYFGEVKNFVTAKELMDRRKNVLRISTGSNTLDELFLGGVETQAITEFIGEFGAGKTQLCHQLAVMVQLPVEKGGLEAKALYIDAEGTFRPERIIQIAKYRGIQPEQALENIIYARAYNSSHQIYLAREAFRMVKNEGIRLVVLDSFIGYFRSEYSGRENLAVRQQKINGHIHDLYRLAVSLNVAVVITNQVISSPDVFFGNPQRPAGGNIIAHASTYRFWIRKGREGKRIVKVLDSPYHPESEAIFTITENGIVD